MGSTERGANEKRRRFAGMIDRAAGRQGRLIGGLVGGCLGVG